MESSSKILLIATDPQGRQMLYERLFPLRASFRETADAAAACDAFRHEAFDLALIGSALPSEDAIRLVQDLREARNIVSILVFCEAGLDLRERLRILEAGANDVIANDDSIMLLAKAENCLRLADLQRRVSEDERRRATTTLVRGLSHQFNNILCGISGAAQLLDMRIDAADRNRKYVASITEGIQRASVISQQLVTFAGARRSSGTDYAYFSECLTLAWNTLCAGTQKSYRLDQQGASTRGLCLPTTPTDLQAILYQILSNAMNAMADGGTIELFIETSDQHLRIRITDHGVGMTPEELKQVFEPFYANAEHPSEVGMGLSLVKALLDQCDASIELESRKGTGTTAYLDFPLARPS